MAIPTLFQVLSYNEDYGPEAEWVRYAMDWTEIEYTPPERRKQVELREYEKAVRMLTE